MKKITFILAALMTCTVTNAQMIEKTELSWNEYNSSINIIPGQFTSSRKDYIIRITTKNTNGMFSYLPSIDVIDDDLNIIKTINIPYDNWKYVHWGINMSTIMNIIELTSVKNGGIDKGSGNSTLLITQTLFNNDDLFEYLTPIYHYKGQEEVAIGFNLMSEDGNTLSTVKCCNISNNDDNRPFIKNIALCQINNKYYLHVIISGTGNNGESHEFYAITPGSTNIKKVDAPIMNVSPRIVGRNENINVTLNDADRGTREISVSNAAGQTVHRATIPAGQNSTQINSSRLSNGLNVVSVKDDKNQRENVKIMVK